MQISQSHAKAQIRKVRKGDEPLAADDMQMAPVPGCSTCALASGPFALTVRKSGSSRFSDIDD
jgi:hypothetical protein